MCCQQSFDCNIEVINKCEGVFVFFSLLTDDEALSFWTSCIRCPREKRRRLLSWSKALVRYGKTIPANSESSPTHAPIETEPRSAEANFINCPSCSVTRCGLLLWVTVCTPVPLTSQELIPKLTPQELVHQSGKVTLFNYLERIIHVNSPSPRV